MTTYAQALALFQDDALLAALLSGQMPDGTAVATVQRTNAGFMGLGQTAKQYVGKQATSTTAATTIPLETVSVGKSFFITDMLLTNDQNLLLDTRIQAAGVDIFRGACRDIAPISMTGIETQPFATSGQQVTILLPITTAVQQFYFTILGFEQ